MPGELLGYFNRQVEISIKEGNAYKQQRNRYLELRDEIYGSPNRPSLLEEVNKAKL